MKGCRGSLAIGRDLTNDVTELASSSAPSGLARKDCTAFKNSLRKCDKASQGYLSQYKVVANPLLFPESYMRVDVAQVCEYAVEVVLRGTLLSWRTSKECISKHICYFSRSASVSKYAI